MTGKYESFKIKLQNYCKNLITMPCPCHASALVQMLLAKQYLKHARNCCEKWHRLSLAVPSVQVFLKNFENRLIVLTIIKKFLNRLKRDGFLVIYARLD